MNIKHICFLLILLVTPCASNADDCGYIECDGFVGYIYVPSLILTNSKSIFVGSNEKEYVITGKESLLFVENGLPDVNSIVTISNNYTSAFSASRVYSIVNNIRNHKEYSLKENMTAEVNVFSCDQYGLFKMQKGAKVKILGYKLFDIELIEEKLFALVEYVSAPKGDKNIPNN